MLKKLVIYTKTTVAEQDTDVNSAGKPIGFDELYATQTGKTTGTGAHRLRRKRRPAVRDADSHRQRRRSHGTGTGGTGVFKGATITAKPANASGTHDAATITDTS